MNYIYIITKTGRAFNDAGVNHVLNRLFDSEKEKNNAVVKMGNKFNNAENLLKSINRDLRKNIGPITTRAEKVYIVLSDYDTLDYISNSYNIFRVIELLKLNPDINSWEILKAFADVDINENINGNFIISDCGLSIESIKILTKYKYTNMKNIKNMHLEDFCKMKHIKKENIIEIIDKIDISNIKKSEEYKEFILNN